MSEKHLTLLVVPHDERNVRRLRLSYRWLKILGVATALLAAGAVVAVATYGRVATRATRAAMLERENRRLTAENAKVKEIERNLARTEQAYEQIRRMAGLPATAAADSLAALEASRAEAEAASPTGALDLSAAERSTDAAQTPPEGPGVPSGWPLAIKGFVSSGFSGPENHPGVDIAAPINTPVVATAAGTVEKAGDDPVYGRYVLLSHPGGYETMYAHDALLLVEKGDRVDRGETIAYSGNSGQSTAPHLHYEVRRDGRAVDPQPYLE